MARRRSRQKNVYLTTRPQEVEHLGNVRTIYEGRTLLPSDMISEIRELGQVLAFVPDADSAMLEECSRALEFEIMDLTNDQRPNTIRRITAAEVTSGVGYGDLIVAPLMNTSGQITGFRISEIGP